MSVHRITFTDTADVNFTFYETAIWCYYS